MNLTRYTPRPLASGRTEFTLELPHAGGVLADIECAADWNLTSFGSPSTWHDPEESPEVDLNGFWVQVMKPNPEWKRGEPHRFINEWVKPPKWLDDILSDLSGKTYDHLIDDIVEQAREQQQSARDEYADWRRDELRDRKLMGE